MTAADLCQPCSDTGRVRLCDWYVDGQPCCADHTIAAVGLVRYEELVEMLGAPDEVNA